MPISDDSCNNQNRPQKRPRILLVEDNRELAQLLALRLTAEKGYDVVMALDGEEALHRVQEDSFDAVILDLMLPKINGVQVLTSLKADPAHHHIPVLILTAQAQEEVKKRLLASGAAAYIKKPFRAQALMEEMDRLLSRHQEPGAAIDASPRPTEAPLSLSDTMPSQRRAPHVGAGSEEHP